MLLLHKKAKIDERSKFTCLAEKNERDIRLQHTREKRNSERTDIRRNKYIVILIFLLLCINAQSDTLWSPDFQGYISGSILIEEGDIVIVDIDSEFSLSYNSSSIESKNITLEFSGGDYGKLLSFLPAVSSKGNLTISGNEEYSLSTKFVTRVTDITENGLLYIEGTRTITLEGSVETLVLNGWVDINDLNKNREVSYSRIADLTIVFTGFIEPDTETITERDIIEIINELETGTTETTGGTQSVTYQLSDQTKTELFLVYVNRLIDIIFR